jgi:FKBP-type peptidyl-prolyl cis-trans isomerase FkpA
MFLALAVLAAVTAGCNNSPASPSTTVQYSQTDLVVGTGAEAAKGSLVTVDYTGWLYDASKPDGKGTQVDTSIGGTPFTFTLGAGQVIAGWEQGVPGMQVGGIRRLVIPPSLAYGGIRNGPIPPNAPLVFEIQLENVQ